MAKQQTSEKAAEAPKVPDSMTNGQLEDNTQVPGSIVTAPDTFERSEIEQRLRRDREPQAVIVLIAEQLGVIVHKGHAMGTMVPVLRAHMPTSVEGARELMHDMTRLRQAAERAFQMTQEQVIAKYPNL